MSSDSIGIELVERTIIGKGLQGLRAKSLVPAVIHDHGKPSIHVSGDYVALSKAYAAAGKHHPVELKVGAKNHLALIKDVDYEPAKRRMRHVVFQAIRQNEAVEAEIPVEFMDVDIPAEKLSLMILQQLDHVEVKALPKDLPDQLLIDPSTLAEVGDHLTVADLKVPAGVTVLTPPETQLAVVEMPKDQEAEANAAAAEHAEQTAGEAEDVESEHGAGADQEPQSAEDQPGTKQQKEPKPNDNQS